MIFSCPSRRLYVMTTLVFVLRVTLVAAPPNAQERERDPFAQLFRADADPFATTKVDLPPLELAVQGAQKPPEPTHTGFKALVVETGRDFMAYPRRRSTWVILAIGGGAAALAHPLDDEVNDKLVGSDAAGNFFAPGKYIGAVYTQAGVAVGLYVAGRYILPHAEGIQERTRYLTSASTCSALSSFPRR